jgi:hypothetical protein
MCEKLIKADFSGISLGDGIRRDQASLANGIKEDVNSEQEIGNQISSAACSMRYFLYQMLTVSSSEGAC